jgi:hypothetical protein
MASMRGPPARPSTPQPCNRRSHRDYFEGAKPMSSVRWLLPAAPLASGNAV